MIGRPNAQNKARKGVLRQSSGGAKRKPAQTQNSFSRARPNAQAALKPPNNSAARGGPKRRTPQTILSATAARRPRWRRGEFANALFSPTTSRRRFPSRTRCGAAPTPARPRRSLAHPPTRAPHRPMPPPQKKKLKLRIGRRADLAAKAARAKRRGHRPGALSQPFHSSPSPTQSPTPSFGDGPSSASQSRGSADGRRNKKRMKGARAETPRIAQFKRETAEDRAGDALRPMSIRPQGGERRKDKRRKDKRRANQEAGNRKRQEKA